MNIDREHKPFYIGANDKEIQEMLKAIGLSDLDQLYGHIDDQAKIQNLELPDPLTHDQIREKLKEIAKKNFSGTSFAGDGLTVFKTPEIVDDICAIRGLTTAYTPYQPERSQGTLISLWLYQSLISELTGFEAVNASLYERSTALFEALKTATRVKRNDHVFVCESIHPNDKEVLDTLAKFTDLKITYIPVDPVTGTTNNEALKELLQKEKPAAIALPQVNGLGLLENVDELTNTAHDSSALVIAIIDPLLISQKGLKRPVDFGQLGADFFVAEGQSLALPANFGGPGLGIFGTRYHEKNKNIIRSTPGRYVGNAKDIKGKPAKAIILSTREQHIRRERATSNICSNQSFVATLASANLLVLGSTGLTQATEHALNLKDHFIKKLNTIKGLGFYNETPSFNSVLLKSTTDISKLISLGLKNNIHIGVDLSGRFNIKENLLLISFNNKQEKEDVDQLISFFINQLGSEESIRTSPTLTPNLLNQAHIEIPKFSNQEIVEYYQKLGKLNLSPDEGLYPLGSCTMKYNPKINDEMAGLKGFTETHPDLPEEFCQGNLELLYETQEWFKKITGLPHVTTQPVAGAQGELVGLKLFQAYHQDRGEERDIILIPESAHGTNPATAVVAGFKAQNIINLKATPQGKIDLEFLQETLKTYQGRISAVMVTNPNTAGIFETDFAKMSQMIHQEGGLVYMDGANMNAIAGRVDLNALGVDAVHNNLHKTWTIPHGGGGPGDAIVAISEKLKDYLPGFQIAKEGELYKKIKPKKSIGSFHRHYGNFAHKVRCYSYLLALGAEGTRKMSAVSVLSARYLYFKLSQDFPMLPRQAKEEPRMHEFILTLSEKLFEKGAQLKIAKPALIGRIGKLFLDFGFHAPTVSFPEPLGLMVEPTESFTKDELDEFANSVRSIFNLAFEHPEVLLTTPHFTPISRVDELSANKNPEFCEKITTLPELFTDTKSPDHLKKTDQNALWQEILKAHEQQKAP